MTTKTDEQKGFTIIEVVLVLAIAALIFLMVFIALPALQRGQRDSQRKSDLSRAQTAITNAQSNSRGSLPTLNAGFISSYLKSGGDDFTDPSGKDYTFTELNQADAPTASSDATSDQTNVRIFYTRGATCDADNAGAVKTGQGARKVALRLVLEGGGISCVNN